MTKYELPDGFQGMESLPKENVKVNILYIDGDICPNMTDYLREVGENPGRVGWAPIVPLKRKVRFVVVEVGGGFGPYAVWDKHDKYRIAERIPTEDAAQRIAVVYDYDPHILDLCDKGSPWLGRYLDDCSQGGISATTIIEANDLEELKAHAQKLLTKKQCYEMWYTEYKVQS